MKGSFFQTPQMPCNVRGSISTMQVEVVECWKYCKYHANCLFGLDGFASFLSSWLCKKLYGLLDFMALFVNLFTRTKATSARKSQTRPTPKPRPQQQQFLACSSSYTTPNNNHKSNSNNKTNNNKKLLLQLTTTAVATIQKLQQLYNNYNCNKNNKTNKNPQLTDNNQQPTTNNQQQFANTGSMPNERFQLQYVANICKFMQNQRFQLPKGCNWHAKWKVPASKCCCK